jgi:hypothetical protein
MSERSLVAEPVNHGQFFKIVQKGGGKVPSICEGLWTDKGKADGAIERYYAEKKKAAANK